MLIQRLCLKTQRHTGGTTPGPEDPMRDGEDATARAARDLRDKLARDRVALGHEG